MSNHHLTDTHISNPDNDLLGMTPHAKRLAEFISNIQPPFIIGVYGQWGEGKTSYVGLTRYYMQQITQKPVVFVNFSAWPYTTSDELWRALTLEIARELCKAGSQDQAPAEPILVADQRPSSFWEYISGFVMKDSLVVWRQPEPPPPDDPCADLEAALNDGLRRSISRRADKQLEVNQEAAFRAILNTALSAIGSVSPLLAGLRGFLGLNQDINLSEIVQEQKNEEAQEDLDSIQKLKDALTRLFEVQARDKLVFVLVDDLDRCLPDVALDLLEAIKIFFEDVECIFLVAADKNLIGQGLRLRYKDLFDQGDPQKTEELLTRKGDEYFEKIVQFGVRVPPRTPKQVHKFVSAQYPKWMPATDIITSAVGNNPRRLKQYCNLLSFTYGASHRSGDGLEE